MDSRMGRLAKNQLYYNRFVSTEEIIEGIEKVKAEEVGALARQAFKPDALSLTILGPVTEKDIPRGLFSA
jgi:predicted Zn-dependent peptidase